MAGSKLGRVMLILICQPISKLMSKLNKLVILFLIFFFSQSGQAENLLDIFRMATEKDPLFLESRQTQLAVQEHKSQEISKLLPQLKLNASLAKLSVTPLDPYNNPTQLGLQRQLYYNGDVVLSIKQPVLALADFHAYKHSNLVETKGFIDYRLTQQDLIIRVAESYFNALAKQGDLDFARAEKNAISRQLQQTKQRFKLGLTAVTDVHEAQARHDIAVAREILAENILTNARENLRTITGVIHERLIGLKADSPLIPPTPSNINEWTNAARVQNLKLTSAKLEIEMEQRRVRQFRSERWPKVDVSAYYNYYRDGSIYGGIGNQYAVSVDLNMDIYDGGFKSSKIRQHQAQEEAAKQRLERLEREVLQVTRDAYLGVLAGMSYVKALNQASQSSRKALEATEAGFEVGTRTAVEVLDAQRDLFRSQRDYAQARYDYVLNMLRLKLAIGLLNIDDLIQVNEWLL